jgi:hypothetical protein
MLALRDGAGSSFNERCVTGTGKTTWRLWTDARPAASIRGMRFVVILAVLCLAACSGNPRDYGITGPGQGPAPPVHPDDSSVGQPGIPDSGTVYGPSVVPNTGSNRYWGYN